jgi:hypothetical protein
MSAPGRHLEVAALGPCPCDGCPHAERCAQEALACSAFALFCSGLREPRWRLAPRCDATHERFVELGLAS